MELKRKIYNRLIEWKNNSNGETAILIDGTRRVGKSHIAEQFAKKNYKSYIIIDFGNTAKEILDLFENESSDLDLFFAKLSAFYSTVLHKRESLIIFDEVQQFPRARQLVKYLVADGRYDYLETGSLIRLKKNVQDIIIPSEEEHIEMFPLDFEEFLWAMDENYLAMAIRDGFTNCTAISDSLHERGLQKYREYLITGGMPASVTTHLNPATTVTETDIRRFILDAYSADTAKFADATQSVRIRASYESIPQQLAKESKKFRYKLAMKGGRAALLGDSIDWLVQSGIVMKCDLVTAGKVPLKAHIDPTSFKLYMSDVGLLSTRVNLTTKTLLQSGTWLGALTENYVAQALTANGHELLYWESGNQAEVDFVIEQESEIVPIEVKASHHVQSKSLTEFSKKYESKLAYRISTRNFGKSGVIESIPLYAAHCIG